MNEIKDGDIFKWSWKPGEMVGQSDIYWCKSRIAIAKNGLLFDTFWSTGDNFKVPADKVDLKFIANMSDLTTIFYDDAKSYDPADVVDLRHCNNSHKENVFIRTGAERSARKMAERIRRAIEDAEREARYLKDKIVRLNAELSNVEHGGDLNFPPSSLQSAL